MEKTTLNLAEVTTNFSKKYMGETVNVKFEALEFINDRLTIEGLTTITVDNKEPYKCIISFNIFEGFEKALINYLKEELDRFKLEIDSTIRLLIIAYQEENLM